MDVYNINDFNGWVAGNFTPSLIKTDQFEFGIKTFKKNTDTNDKHYHKKITEYNIILSGKVIINNKTLFQGDIFVIYPYEIVNSVFLEDTTFAVIKVPSLPSDKFNVNT